MTTFLLHGLARSARSMRPMKNALTAAGMTCVNIGYPSRRYNIETLARQHVLPQLVKSGVSNDSNFVTHSMGGIILRYLVHHQLIAPPQAAVMLAPPNHGSELVDKLGTLKLGRIDPYGWLNGPAGQQLGTKADSLPNQLGSLTFATGIIIGNRSLDPLQLLLTGASDGKVTLASSQLDEMQDFLVLPVGHTWIMADPEVQAQTLHFLQHGFFSGRYE